MMIIIITMMTKTMKMANTLITKIKNGNHGDDSNDDKTDDADNNDADGNNDDCNDNKLKSMGTVIRTSVIPATSLKDSDDTNDDSNDNDVSSVIVIGNFYSADI